MEKSWSKMTIYIGNDIVVSITLLDQSGAPVSGATVTCTIYESDGATEVSGLTWPVVMEHQGSGVYEGIVDKAASFYEDNAYIVDMTAQAGTADLRRRERQVARYMPLDGQ